MNERKYCHFNGSQIWYAAICKRRELFCFLSPESFRFNVFYSFSLLFFQFSFSPVKCVKSGNSIDPDIVFYNCQKLRKSMSLRHSSKACLILNFQPYILNMCHLEETIKYIFLKKNRKPWKRLENLGEFLSVRNE